MARKRKYPEHEAEAERLMNELLDLIVLIWTAEEEPELKMLAEETGLSPAKIRKLLITAGERDKKTYYRSELSVAVLALYHRGMTIKEIQEVTGLSYQSVHGYLPYSKTVSRLFNDRLQRLHTENKKPRVDPWKKKIELRHTAALTKLSLFLVFSIIDCLFLPVKPLLECCNDFYKKIISGCQ